MKKVAILQSNYIPWKGYFDIINSVDTFIIYDEVQYTKNDWRNRNQIMTKQGPIWLTIPVKQETLHQKICETKISLENWNKKHWNSIVASYGKANNFKNLKEQFEELYLKNNLQYISEINLAFIKKINEIFQIETEIIDSRDLNLLGDKNEKLIDAIKKVKGDIYLSGPAAKEYLDKEMFSRENILVQWKSYSEYPTYETIHNNFSHNISILDVIFNNDKLSTKLITSSNQGLG